MADHVFVVGAGSYVGGSVVRTLLAHGSKLSALARDETKAAALDAIGVEPVRAQIEDIMAATDAMRDYDACIWLSFVPLRTEQALLASVLDGLVGSGKTFIFTSGTAVLGIPTPDGEWREESFAEEDRAMPPPRQIVRAETEALVRSYADKGVRVMIVRPPLIWGHGGSRQVPWVFETVEKTGKACYLGLGLNCYSHVHVDDLAELYRLALAKGVAGAVYHAVAGEENFRTIAEAVAEVMETEAASVDVERLGEILGRSVAETGFAISSRSRCPRSRTELGWAPRHVDLIDDIRHGSYLARFGTAQQGRKAG